MHRNFVLSSVATDGEDGHGLKLEKVKVARLDFLGGIPPKFEH